MSRHVLLRYTSSILIVLGLSLALFYVLMHPPMGDLGLMAQFLTITAVISAGAGYAAYRLGWMDRSPSLRLTLMGIYALASALAFFNVWITARLMFASEHDLMLSVVLLIFAGGIAMVLGYFLSSAISDRLRGLEETAENIQEGDLSARAPERGNDELSALAVSFNRMAERLQEADQKQRELDNLRRELVAWSGHDLQTPLASMRAIIEALVDGIVDDPETVQRYLQTARRDIQNLSLLIDDLFQMAQLDTGGLPLQCEPTYLSDLISDTLESFSELAHRQGISLSGSVEPEVGIIQIDVQRIGRVLNNLIGNAIRHTPSGGVVTVYASATASCVQVSVQDTGEGIRPEDLPHVFDRFYRGEKSRSRATGGAGLGLAIAKGIVEAHGGTINCESKQGSGTRFQFDLPVRN